MFKHNLVEPVSLKRVNIDGTRFYILPDGITKLKSVTTILSEKSDNRALYKWRKKVGEAEAKRISGLATSRGNSIHKIAEKFVLNEENYMEKAMPSTLESFIPIKETLENHVDDILSVELKMYSKTLGAAGATDLVASYNGIRSIIDFKGSNKPKKEEWIENYFLQSTAYSMMFEQMYKIPIKQVVIIISVDHEPKPQIFIRNRKDYVNKVIDIFTK